MTFSVAQITSTIGSKATAIENTLATHLTNMDPNSSADLMLMQQYMQEWSLITNLQTTVLKTLKDALMSVVQKMQ